MMKKISLMLAACTVLPGIALADVSARVSIGELSYKLYDLRPNDGIAPSLTFADMPTSPVPAPLGSSQVTTWGDWDFTELVASGTSPLVAEFDSANSSFKATIGGRDAALTHNIVTEAFSSSSGGSTSIWSNSSVEPLNFVVAPYTQFSFTFHTSVNAHVTGQAPDDGVLIVDTNYALGGPDNFAFDGKSWSLNVNSNTDSLNVTESFTLVYSNITAEEQRGYVSFGMYVLTGAGASNPVSPVPEPATVSMLAVGCAVLGMSQLRRRKRPKNL